MELIHQHLLYQSKVNNDSLKKITDLEKTFKKFLNDLLEQINMTCLIPPQIKISHLDAWTGMVGIITSHITFHYWVHESYVQLDIYSCTAFNNNVALNFINEFWKAKEIKALSINREVGKSFIIEEINQ